MVRRFGPSRLERGAMIMFATALLVLATAETAIGGPKCNAWPTDAQTLYTPGETPSTAVRSSSPLVLGHKMAFSVTGTINAVRHYKSSSDTGEALRYARVYSWPQGKLLATTDGLDATFCNGGWVSMPLIAPLRVVKDQTYVVAIDSLQTYVRSSDFLFTDKSRGGVTLLHDGAVYSRRTDCVPAENKGIKPSTSYWIDVDFVPVRTKRFKCGLWPNSDTIDTLFTPVDRPQSNQAYNGQPVVLGQQFSTTKAGVVTAFRYFKSPADSGTLKRSGRIYSWPDGALLGRTPVFTDSGCLRNGWVSVPLTSPLKVQANKVYVMALDMVEYYVKTDGDFVSDKASGALVARAGGALYGYISGTMPGRRDGKRINTNYWLDVEFRPRLLNARCGIWPESKFTTIFTAYDMEPTDAYNDGQSVVLGVRIVPKAAGSFTSLRWYKAAEETSTSQVGKIYSWPHGKLLGTTGRFSSCQGPKWISTPFTSPVVVTAGTQYVLALEGVKTYAKTSYFFTEPKRNGALVALSSVYSPTEGGFPYYDDLEADNYYIDCEFLAHGPVLSPTLPPAARPTVKPTIKHTLKPTAKPTVRPTPRPTVRPTTTPRPTTRPTVRPTARPTPRPTPSPSVRPTTRPTQRPSPRPTIRPTLKPAAAPTVPPTVRPTVKPTVPPTMNPTVRPTIQPTANPPAPTPAGACDELSPYRGSGDSITDPVKAMDDYGKRFRRYPTKTVLGTCGDLNGFVSSIARPGFFQTPMFTDMEGNEVFNNEAGVLPIAKTYIHEGRYLDVFEEIVAVNVVADLFSGERTAANPAAPLDTCRPAGYTGTPGFRFSSASVGARLPGPMIKQCSGRQSLIRFCNQLDLPVDRSFSIHFHGSASTPAYDGWAEDITNNLKCKEYLYPDNRAGWVWYHDHSVSFTGDNTLFGLAGIYMVRDCDKDIELNFFPKPEFTIPFVVKDFVLKKRLEPNGNALLEYQAGFNNPVGDAHTKYFFGDIMTVNGKPWPYLKVEPRTYRISILNACTSREVSIKLIAETATGEQAWVPFYLFDTDGGKIQFARKLWHIYATVAERYEILVSFDQADLPALPEGSSGPWQYVYAVNDLGNQPDSDAPQQFCKTHVLNRFDLEKSFNPDPELAAEIDEPGKYPPSRIIQPYRGLRNIVSNSELEFFKQRALNDDVDRTFAFGTGRRLIANYSSNVADHLPPFDVSRKLFEVSSETEDEGQLAGAQKGKSGTRKTARGNPLARRTAKGLSRGLKQWKINGALWEDGSPIRANPPRDGIELWKIKGAGGWHHPVHIHLSDYLVIRANRDGDAYNDWDILTQSRGVFKSRSPFSCANGLDNECGTAYRCNAGQCVKAAGCNDDRDCMLGTYCNKANRDCVVNGVRPWEVDAPKDVAYLGNGHDLYLLARYGPFSGEYMFHCHNGVHEDNSMMASLSVDRIPPVGPDSGAEPGDGRFGITPGGVSTDVNSWVARPYRSQVTNTAPARNFDGLSPHSPAFRNGVINELMRNPQSGLLQFDQGIKQDVDVNNPDYFCRFFYDGIYDIFYPSDKANLTRNHLPVRSIAELRNQNFPGSDVPGSYYYNPIQRNIWAVDYTQLAIGNPKSFYQRRLPTWNSVECPAEPV